MLSDTIKYIEFGEFFNQNVDFLPELTETIIFGSSFCQPVDMLPKKVKTIHFGHMFDQSVDFLPKSVEIVKFGHDFRRNISMLPKNIKEITIDYRQYITINSIKSYFHTINIHGLPTRQKLNLPFSLKDIKGPFLIQEGKISKKIKKIPYGCCIIKKY